MRALPLPLWAQPRWAHDREACLIHGGDNGFRGAQVNFDPKKLLASILQLYLNAYDADRGGAFAAAVAADGRSYRPENFTEALRIATELGLPGFGANHCSKLKMLAAAVQREKADEEARNPLLHLLICLHVRAAGLALGSTVHAATHGPPNAHASSSDSWPLQACVGRTTTAAAQNRCSAPCSSRERRPRSSWTR